MMQCGLKHKWYLIEEFTKHVKHWNSKDTAIHGGRGFSHKALESSIAATAALPGYAKKHKDKCFYFISSYTQFRFFQIFSEDDREPSGICGLLDTVDPPSPLCLPPAPSAELHQDRPCSQSHERTCHNYRTDDFPRME